MLEPTRNAFGHVHYDGTVKSPNPPTLGDLAVRRQRTRLKQIIGACFLLPVLGIVSAWVVSAWAGAWPLGAFFALISIAIFVRTWAKLDALDAAHPRPGRAKRRGF